MTELVQGAQRKALVDDLHSRGYYGAAVTIAANMILDGERPGIVLAILEPEFSRAYQTRAWLDQGAPTLALEAPAELAEHGEPLPPRHAFEDQLRNQRKDT